MLLFHLYIKLHKSTVIKGFFLFVLLKFGEIELN